MFELAPPVGGLSTVGVRGAKVVLESLLGPALPDLALLYDVREPQGEVPVGASEAFFGGEELKVDAWCSVGVGGVLMMTGPGTSEVLLGGVAGGRPVEMRFAEAGVAN